MKRLKKIFYSLTHPSPEQTYPLIAMYSNQRIVIEQVDDLISFSQTKISFLCQLGTIEAIGENLYILTMKQNELVIEGMIHEVKFFPKQKT